MKIIKGLTAGILLGWMIVRPVTAADLIVDFGLPKGTMEHKATGFEWIFPMDLSVQQYLKDVNPYIVKDPWGNQATAKSLGAKKVQWLVGNNVIYNRIFVPWQDINRWAKYVVDYVTGLTPNNEEYEWIIWQEPDSSDTTVWRGTQEQFFLTWQVAVANIRSIRPNAVIIGPSPEKFNIPFLQSFLIYAKANNVLPDVLSWHELYDLGFKTPNGEVYTPDLIPGHIQTMRNFMAGQGININRFDITEYQGIGDRYKPGMTAAFIANLEAAGSQGSRGNWAEANQIAGLVTSPTSPQPRSVWWVYKRYGEMKGTLYTTTLVTAVNGLGTYDANSQKVMVLLGSQGLAGNKTIELNRIPSGVGGRGRVKITLERITDTETAALPAPIIEGEWMATLTNGNLSVPITNLGANDASVITLNRPPLLNVNYDNGRVIVNYSNDRPTTSDKIGLYLPGASNAAPIDWKWLDNSNDASRPPTTLMSTAAVTLTGQLSNQTYEVRYIRNGETWDTMPVRAAVKIAGDANGDGKTDLADFAIWKKEYLGQASTRSADFNENGSVDLADFAVWKGAYL